MLQTIDIKLQSQGQPLAPSAEIQRLHLFVEKWKTEGETHASADAPAVKVTGMDTYEWLSGKFFLVHRANGHIGNEELSTIEFIGYDASSQTYTCHSFDRRGSTDSFRATLRVGEAYLGNRTWTIEGKSARFTGLFNSIGSYGRIYLGQRIVRDGVWIYTVEDYRTTYVLSDDDNTMTTHWDWLSETDWLSLVELKGTKLN
jgi:Protein of unknown function (DUF1579)